MNRILSNIFGTLFLLSLFSCKKEDIATNNDYYAGVSFHIAGKVIDTTANAPLDNGSVIFSTGWHYVSTNLNWSNSGAIDTNGNFSFQVATGPPHLIGSNFKLYAVNEEYVGYIDFNWLEDDIDNLIIPVQKIAYAKFHIKNTTNIYSVLFEISDFLVQEPLEDFYSNDPNLDTTFLVKCFPNKGTFYLARHNSIIPPYVDFVSANEVLNINSGDTLNIDIFY